MTKRKRKESARRSVEVEVLMLTAHGSVESL